MHPKLSSRKKIRAVAEALASHLETEYKDFASTDWTEHVFEMLRNFCEKELGVIAEDCYHRHHPNGKTEFLWDFMASQKDLGILIAAESEQQSEKASERQSLKHDFEKLLYVFAPIRVLICKHSDKRDARELLGELQKSSGQCCLAFNPGAVFLVHFCWWHEDGSESYIWQSDGTPSELKSVTMNFQPLEKSS